MPFILKDLQRAGRLKGLAYDSMAYRTQPKVYSHEEYSQLAMDAAMITTQSNGIPAALTTVIHPELITVLFAPMNSTLLFPEIQVGSRTMSTVMFRFLEHKGSIASYGDYAVNGVSGANVNFPQGQPWAFQTTAKWGDIEIEQMAEANLDWVGEQQRAVAEVIARTFNTINFNGVANLQNYGIFNDPSLIATDVPVTVSGHSTWATKFAANDALSIKADFSKAVGLLMTQTAGRVNQKSKLVVGIPPSQMTYLDTPMVYGWQTVLSMVQSNYPNMRIETIPEFESSGSGNWFLIAAEELDGKPVGRCLFVEKMRAHGVLRKESSFVEKRSASSVGFRVFRPSAVVRILGI